MNGKTVGWFWLFWIRVNILSSFLNKIRLLCATELHVFLILNLCHIVQRYWVKQNNCLVLIVLFRTLLTFDWMHLIWPFRIYFCLLIRFSCLLEGLAKILWKKVREATGIAWSWTRGFVVVCRAVTSCAFPKSRFKFCIRFSVSWAWSSVHIVWRERGGNVSLKGLEKCVSLGQVSVVFHYFKFLVSMFVCILITCFLFDP